MTWVILPLAGILVLSGASLAWIVGAASILAFVTQGRQEFLAILPQRMFSQVDLFVFLALPMFVLAGEIMNRSGVTRVLIDLARAIFGRLRGGLGYVNILASVFFAGISGSAIADTAALSNTLVPAMKERGYPGAYAAAITAASSVIGPIIPPSIILVLYGSLFQLSIGALFVAGVLPGLVMAAGLMVANGVIAKKHNHPGGSASDCPPLWPSLLRALPALSLPVIIVGGIVFGLTTPTEAGAIAVVASLICGRIYGGITWQGVMAGLERTALTYGTVFGILAALSLLAWLFALEGMPEEISRWLNGVGLSGLSYFLAMAVVFAIAGAVADIGLSLFLLAPILVPIAVAQGFHPLQVGIVATVTMIIGGVTPPVGSLLLIASSVAGEPFGRVVKAALPLILTKFVVVGILIFVPQISLALPRWLELIP
ncbi:MAG: TRAP transporter large permease [Alphaproteobacteria bacterium]|nr:TRAP transporter large permease [Alphaproteobacteria bacterium]